MLRYSSRLLGSQRRWIHAKPKDYTAVHDLVYHFKRQDHFSYFMSYMMWTVFGSMALHLTWRKMEFGEQKEKRENKIRTLQSIVSCLEKNESIHHLHSEIKSVIRAEPELEDSLLLKLLASTTPLSEPKPVEKEPIEVEKKDNWFKEKSLMLGVVVVLIWGTRYMKGQRKIAGERVVIVGCSSGIGQAVAMKYAARGARLILMARRTDLLATVSERCIELGAETVDWQGGDVTDERSLEALKQLTESKLGGVDTVIYCAGMLSVRPFRESMEVPGALETMTSVNYYGAVWTARWFEPLLAQSSVAPNLMVISSMAGKVGAPTRALYAGAKHALHGFFDSLRLESSVHVGLICPGTVDTDLRASAVDRSMGITGSTQNKLSASKVAERIIAASDQREREIYLPPVMGYTALWAQLMARPLVDWFAARKYR
ncbi:hypothetical protein BY458DRAFT_494717 [Sporodiniella umbellata]|nr:hypothetical protein BY458DRAFT_494717 [Sporodiniella umbellata]